MVNVFIFNIINVVYIIFIDVKGNFYYILSNSKMSLNVYLKDQNFKIDDGRINIRGCYVMVWFDYFILLNNVKYEYVVLILMVNYYRMLIDLVIV